jgi:hypothetical protein
MQWKAGEIVVRVVRLEVIEQEEGIEVVESPATDTAPETHAGAFHDWLWLDHSSDASRLSFHVPFFSTGRRREPR